MKLITEVTEDIQYISEEKNGKRNLYIEGVFLQSNLTNRNNRTYPKEIMRKEVDRYRTEQIDKKRAMGELGHPDGPIVNLDRVSHMVTSLERDGDNFIGEAKIMNTPMGKIVKNIMDEGGTLGVSSRGMGSLEQKNGANYVKPDFMLAAAADIVADPSAPKAFVNGIMEGKEWVWCNGILKETEVAKYKKIMSDASRRDVEDKTLQVFEHFLSNL